MVAAEAGAEAGSEPAPETEIESEAVPEVDAEAVETEAGLQVVAGPESAWHGPGSPAAILLLQNEHAGARGVGQLQPWEWAGSRVRCALF